MFKRTVLVAGLVTAINLGTSALALAHGPGATFTNQPCGWHQGWHMGSMMDQQGQMPMMGHGMMGQGRGMGPMMGHGMMDQQGQMPMTGQGQRPMMGQQGQMPMMGRSMMGPGYGMGQGMGPGMMHPLRQDLTAAEVEHMIGHRLAWQGNPNVKVGTVEEIDDDTIVAEIVTQDGSLVQRLEVDRHTGWMHPVQ
jgi:hypothetical protein